jgi:hypothetical protein
MVSRRLVHSKVFLDARAAVPGRRGRPRGYCRARGISMRGVSMLQRDELSWRPA